MHSMLPIAAEFLSPIIKKGVRSLDDEGRRRLRATLIAAQRTLADRTLPLGDRLSGVAAELEALSGWGPTWCLLVAKLREYAVSGGAPRGPRELAAVSLILGQVLETLARDNQDKVA